MKRSAIVVAAAACASRPQPFALRDPFVLDTDLRPVSVPCRADPAGRTCAPAVYQSPFIWDHVDNLVFAPLSRALGVSVSAEAANINSLDEVPDSAWFTNRTSPDERSVLGGCTPGDFLPDPDRVAPGAWKIDHGKDNGSSLGFRVDIDGARYLLKADDLDTPERASAAAVIGTAIYHAAGFNTTCEQVVRVRARQFTLAPGLHAIANTGARTRFDQAALAHTLASTTVLPDGSSRMQASKWLAGVPLGPFRYAGTRADDPNDIIPHEDRRELRGSSVLAAWLGHWDAREQNSMDVWIASDAEHPRSSPGYVRHYILDTSELFGGRVDLVAFAPRLGHAYTVDLADIGLDLVTLGLIERPWDRAHVEPGHERFAYFSVRDFDPDRWKPLYPNPAFLRMTERDAAWMARIIARFSPEDIRRFVDAGKLDHAGDAAYLTRILLARQRIVLARYFSRLSPLGAIHRAADGRICATDFARLRGVFPHFAYTIVERGGGAAWPLAPELGDDAVVCFTPRAVGGTAGAPRPAVFELRDGTRAGPLLVHVYDQGLRGFRIVGAERPAR
ncbi:MAG TPA: hypothetical protein VLX92_03660 [Kofleriaceae bacterium]|nr:hypothetical protein [Kofleriaceae bacterium]